MHQSNVIETEPSGNTVREVAFAGLATHDTTS